MSISVTVNGNPVCVRRSRMVLSDFEQIRKNERDRRRRLRLEQVRQQSKEISCKLLEQVKSRAKKELNKLTRNGKSEMRMMHDRKIMEIQKKYQEDMEDIGLAHSAAALQPDVDAIIEVDKRKNRATAAERGKEATQRLKESAQKEDPLAIQQERLRRVREVENVRSALVAKLSNKSNSSKDNEGETNSSQEDEIIVEKTTRASPKRKKNKKLVVKNSPAKVLSKSNVKVVGSRHKSKSPRQHITVEVHRGNTKSPKRAKSKTVCKASAMVGTEDDFEDSPCKRDNDDQEPRKAVPTIRLTPTKADKVARYNPEDYKQKTSDSKCSSSSSVSDDSSYFSDSCGEFLLPKTTPKHHTSMASSKVELYDYCTRQRNTYNQPIGLVERTDIRCEPNAVDAAREITQAENLAANVLESRRLAAQRRGDDALLRERVRRDYDAMIKNLNNMIRDERVPKSSRQCCTNRHTIESRRKDRSTDLCTNTEPECEIILHDTSQPGPSRGEDERVIKICTRDGRERTRICPDSTRQDPPIYERPKSHEGRDVAEEMSREELIFEAFKNVERQKRLLLREYGADLPDNIFTASMTPLLDNRQTTTGGKQKSVGPSIAQPSSEIKIINMSSSDENVKRSGTGKKKSKNKTKTQASRTMETAVQTSTMDEIGAAKDKSVQVEIITEESGVSRRKDESPRNETSVASGPPEHVEPLVTVITPEVYDTSSGSSISPGPGIVIELKNQQVKVTPRKRIISSEKSSKRGTSRGTSKPRSLPSSIPGSPVKRCVTSAPSSRSGSPKKQETVCQSRSRSPDKIVDIVINNDAVKVQAGPSRPIQMINGSSIESSPPHSTPEIQENLGVTGKPYRIFKHPTFKKIRESRDTSDTSTSYASLPVKTSTIQSSRHQITPILEMLDSSANESVRPMRIKVSPVSTPETPSPRIINVPSNVPNPDRIGRILKYGKSTVMGNSEDSTLPSSTRNEFSSSTDPSHSNTSDQKSNNNNYQPAINSRRSGKSSDYCSCANPTCQLLHDNMSYVRDYATTNNPEVLEKYEDLRNVCTERIASLTELIERVRNEQRGMEFSIMSPADETSLMQLPPPGPFRSDFQNVQRLVESIESIHSKLAKTLHESQKIITNGAAAPPRKTPNPEIPASSPSYETKSKGSASTSTEETSVPRPAGSSKPKPVVIANEPVKIDLDRLKRGRGPYTAMVVQTENPPWPEPGTPRRHEEIVAKLYQEILEQSKTVDNSREKSSTSGDRDGSLGKQRTPSPPQNLAAARKSGSPRKVTEVEVTKDERQSPRPRKDEEFVPLLAGIPKIPRALPSMQSGTRSRPPPAGAYRSEIVSPRHELSTIVEFDTPDTANRSQGSTRSPGGKSRRILQLQSPTKPTSSPRSSTEKNHKIRTIPVEQSVEFAPLISENVSRPIPRRLTTRNVGSPDEKFVFYSDNDRAMSERGTTKSLLSQGPNTSIEGSASMKRDDDEKLIGCFVNGGAERDGTEQRDNGSKGESCETADEKLTALVSNNLNADSVVVCENKGEKLTSTSSNSFSGLSGFSEIVSSPTSELVKWASSSEEIESALKKMGLGWAIVTLKKTREASALSSSSNSDLTPVNTARRTKSPSKKQSLNDCNLCGLPDFSDVSSISIKEASKSTERAVLMKARTSTPNIQNSNSTSEKSASATTSSSGISVQDHSDSLTAPNVSLVNNQR